MGSTGVLERQAGTPRPPEPPSGRGRRARAILIARRALALLLVVAATVAGGYLALVSFTDTRDLSVGEIRLSVSPGHRGAIDVYVPLVDWGARFENIRLPVRLRVNLQTVNRTVAGAVAQGEPLNLDSVRTQATDAIASYLKQLIALVVVCGALLGLLVAFAIRSRAGPKLRYTAGAAVLGAVAMGVAIVVLIPPRGEIQSPQYYAHGPDIPRALEAVEAVRRTPGALDQELDAQLVGLARLVVDPGRRRSLTGQPVVTVASDLHNNPFGLSVLSSTARGGPVFFVGDLTDRGTPLETRVVRQAVDLGHPFVFVSGNHDSDFLVHELATEGAIVLTRKGRLMPKGGFGPKVVHVAGLRVAGYDDPFERRTADDFKDRYDNTPDPEQQDEFTSWLRPLIGKVDVVMVHEPALIAPALAILRDDPPTRPLVFMVGHTHIASLGQQPGVTVINGGSVGAGGTGNLTEKTNIGIARFTFTLKPSFQPLAADLVTIDPGTGSSSARRTRLDPAG
jgi:predicted phosphodiesterase